MQVYTYSEARPNLSGVILPATEKSGWSNFWFLNLLSPGYLFPSLKQIISVSRYFLLNNHKAPSPLWKWGLLSSSGEIGGGHENITFILSLDVIYAPLYHENRGSRYWALFITSFVVEWSGELFYGMTRTTITLLTGPAGIEAKPARRLAKTPLGGCRVVQRAERWETRIRQELTEKGIL